MYPHMCTPVRSLLNSGKTKDSYVLNVWLLGGKQRAPWCSPYHQQKHKPAVVFLPKLASSSLPISASS